ncbi:hypothetical protein VHUM_02488 [Vanrija humicola]|uniref:Selenoprotein O n=1 Tax=Vanrija humicola TaxID=5417 RepID=A0A7D8UYR8_VANHU|nr:hypothetical protein VHUM_02488 [Vanrija humicola]
MTQLQQSTSKVPIHRLPRPQATLQRSLKRLPLGDSPVAQRRANVFPASSRGVWARVNPLWDHWPIQITKEELAELGVDLDKGEQISVEDVLKRWGPTDVLDDAEGGLKVLSSKHRLKLEPNLLGVADPVLSAALPQLDVGDAQDLNAAAEAGTSTARDALVDILSGRKVLSSEPGAEESVEYGPWSTRYTGHQFGQWAGQLGDGRAISLLETTSELGGRQEIQVKGAGRTPFSRQADGLAVLRSSVREYLGAEAIAALGIPSTRSLAILTSPVEVAREMGYEPSSLVARVAPSFIRIGHFEAMNPGEAGRNTHTLFLGGQWQKEEKDENDPLGGQGNLEGLRDLTAWVKNDVMNFEGSVKDWFLEVVKRNAETTALWQVYGFMHGVLNTDNISILGLTIDYGPYAFMDQFNPGHICNHSDPTGLYSYKNQPPRVAFALDSLASALLPLLGYEKLNGKAPAEGWAQGASTDDVRKWEEAGLEAINGWSDDFIRTVELGEREAWGRRFGLRTYQDSDDRDVVTDFLSLLRAHGADFNASLRELSNFEPSKIGDDAYRRAYAKRWVANTTIDLKSDSVMRAEEGITAWLRVYAARVTSAEEKAAWEKDAPDGEWEEIRTVAMRAVNPRFVLRQWLLEETIKTVDEALKAKDVAGARKVLARVLDLATHPFESYGEDGECAANPSDEDVERMRLCGLGPQNFLGFQCSCSS